MTLAKRALWESGGRSTFPLQLLPHRHQAQGAQITLLLKRSWKSECLCEIGLTFKHWQAIQKNFKFFSYGNCQICKNRITECTPWTWYPAQHYSVHRQSCFIQSPTHFPHVPRLFWSKSQIIISSANVLACISPRQGLCILNDHNIITALKNWLYFWYHQVSSQFQSVSNCLIIFSNQDLN